jgi:hypothetical protein
MLVVATNNSVLYADYLRKGFWGLDKDFRNLFAYCTQEFLCPAAILRWGFAVILTLFALAALIGSVITLVNVSRQHSHQ